MRAIDNLPVHLGWKFNMAGAIRADNLQALRSAHGITITVSEVFSLPPQILPVTKSLAA